MNKGLWAAVAAVVIIGGGAIIYAASHKSNSSANNIISTNDMNMSSSSSSGGSNASSSSSSSGQAATTSSVTIANFAFSPSSISVKKGTKVTWTNNDSTTHHVVETDSKAGPDSGNLAPGSSYSFTYDTTGTFAYHCSIHPEMTGTVTVTE